jgi:hypothetical protein
MLTRSRSSLAAGAGVRITRRTDRSRVSNRHATQTLQTSAGEPSGRTYGPSPALRHRRPPIVHKKQRQRRRPSPGYRHADLVGRDYELQDVLDRIAADLQAVEHIRTPEHDDRLTLIEAELAPYALALFYEILHLDGLLIGKHRRRRQAR